MKSIFLGFLMMLFSFIASAQYETIFGNSSTSWNLFKEIIDAFVTDSLSVTGDTSINSINYKIVKGNYSKQTYFLRESIDHSKAYYFNPLISNSEFLVFDLTLAKTDTFRIGQNQSEILIVDSVFTIEGKKHITFNYEIGFALGTEKLEFIEGVGANFGLFFQGIDPYNIGQRHYLLCASKDGYKSYSNKSYYGICYVSIGLGIAQDLTKNKIKVFPNPTNSKLMIDIDSPTNESYILYIYDNLGQVVVSENIYNQDKIQLNLEEFESGLYYYSLINNVNGQKYVGKIVKNAR